MMLLKCNSVGVIVGLGLKQLSHCIGIGTILNFEEIYRVSHASIIIHFSAGVPLSRNVFVIFFSARKIQKHNRLGMTER